MPVFDEGVGEHVLLVRRYGAEERVGEQGGAGAVRTARERVGGGEDAAAGGDLAPAEERVGGDELRHGARVKVHPLPEELRVELLQVAQPREAVGQ
jgi:hypothetical protein